MVIHFLQQLDPPVLPCLHEYVFGVDHVPLTLHENQYKEFFRLCNDYSPQWKSENTSTIEILFLQLLSYYVKTFHSKQFVVSIQTRMPVVKIDKNWHSRKLLVEGREKEMKSTMSIDLLLSIDPTDIKRNLCQTMQSMRSINYFRDTLNTALNYFGRKQKKIRKASLHSPDDDLIEIIVEEENEIPVIEPTNALHHSYELFSKKFPPTIFRDVNIRQNRLRDFYKNLFSNPLSPPLMISDEPFNELEQDDENELFQRILSNEDEESERKESIV